MKSSRTIIAEVLGRRLKETSFKNFFAEIGERK